MLDRLDMHCVFNGLVKYGITFLLCISFNTQLHSTLTHMITNNKIINDYVDDISIC